MTTQRNVYQRPVRSIVLVPPPFAVGTLTCTGPYQQSTISPSFFPPPNVYLVSFSKMAFFISKAQSVPGPSLLIYGCSLTTAPVGPHTTRCKNLYELLEGLYFLSFLYFLSPPLACELLHLLSPQHYSVKPYKLLDLWILRHTGHSFQATPPPVCSVVRAPLLEKGLFSSPLFLCFGACREGKALHTPWFFFYITRQ